MPISNPNPQQRDVVIYQRDDTNSYWGEAHISGSNLIFYIDAQGHINADTSASFYSLFPPSGGGGGGSGTTLVTGGLYPITSSWAISASWAPSTGGGSGTTLVTGGLYQITASWALNAGTTLITGSTYPITASWSQTSSWAVNVINALVSTAASSSLFASSSVSSSVVNILTTASNAQYYIPFVLSSSFQPIFIDPNSIYYNPGTDTLQVNNISASAISGTLFGTASQAVVAGLVNAIATTGTHTVALLGSNSGIVNIYADGNDNIRWDINNQILFAKNIAGTASYASQSFSASNAVTAQTASTVYNPNMSIAYDGTAQLLDIFGRALSMGSDALIGGNLTVDGNFKSDQADPTTFLITSDGSGHLTASAFKGPLVGTASWAQNVVTSSNSLTASYVTASNVFGTVGNATNAGFANQAVQATSSLSASYITASNIAGIVPTASVALNANSASVAVTASFALNFNPSATASFANQAGTASLANTASYAFTASFMNAALVFISSSIQNNNYTYWTAISGSGQAFTLATSSNIVDSGSFAVLTGTASWALNALTSSNVISLSSASWATTSLSASVVNPLVTNIWTNYTMQQLIGASNSNIPSGVYRMMTTYVSGTVWLFGGRTGGAASQIQNVIWSSSTSPLSILATSKTLPYTLYNGDLHLIGNSLYIFGGITNQNGTANYTASILTASVQDPTNWMIATASLPTAIAYHNIVKIGDKLWLLNGATPLAAPQTASYTASIFNPTQWGNANLVSNHPVYAGRVVNVDNILYTYGGVDTTGQTFGLANQTYTASVTAPNIWATGSSGYSRHNNAEVWGVGDQLFLYGDDLDANFGSNVINVFSGSNYSVSPNTFTWPFSMGECSPPVVALDASGSQKVYFYGMQRNTGTFTFAPVQTIYTASIISGSSTTSANFRTHDITSSLNPNTVPHKWGYQPTTASFTVQQITSSWAITASNANLATLAISASNAFSASNAITASLALTASFSQTSSFSQTASFAQTASQAYTASAINFLMSNDTSSFYIPFVASGSRGQFTGSGQVMYIDTSSIIYNPGTNTLIVQNISSSGGITASFAGSIANSTSASYAVNATSASYVPASGVDGTVATASWALNVVNVTMDILAVQVFS